MSTGHMSAEQRAWLVTAGVAALLPAVSTQIAIPVCGVALAVLYYGVSLGCFSLEDSRRTERRVFLGVQTVFLFLALIRLDFATYLESSARRNLSWSGLVVGNSLLAPLASPLQHLEVIYRHIVFVVVLVGAAWTLDRFSAALSLQKVDGFLEHRPITRMLTGVVVFFSIMWAQHLWTVPSHCEGVPVEDDMSLMAQAHQLVVKWREYHPPEFVTVRLAHCLTYPSMLHGAIGAPRRPNYVAYAGWCLLRIYIGGLLLADWVHYADSPVVAGVRLGYNDELCTSVARVFFRTLFGHPLNVCFLVTE